MPDSNPRRDTESYRLGGFELAMRLWGWSCSGWDRLAFVCELQEHERSEDMQYWDQTAADLKTQTLNGYPVPEWWALAGARGRQDFHDSSEYLRRIRRG